MKAIVTVIGKDTVGIIADVCTLLAAQFVVPALPYLLSFAAGAMLYVVVEELIPEMSQGTHSSDPASSLHTVPESFLSHRSG